MEDSEERKLASIEIIQSLEPIENADSIELAKVKGWEVVVKKWDFRVGDWCIYCEIDSVFPDHPEFEFLKPRGMRIKTIRLRGQISQGICFRPGILLLIGAGVEKLDCYEGMDVTKIMGITKYEPPISICQNGIIKGNFPSFIPKTNEERIQNIRKKVLEDFKDEDFYITEKLDGTSATYYVKDNHFGVCSRNSEYEECNNIYWEMAKKYNIKELLSAVSSILECNIAVQGEIIGEKIQGNKYKIKGNQFQYFGFYNIDKCQYIPFEEVFKCFEEIPPFPNDFISVPISINYHRLLTIKDYIHHCKIKSELNKDIWAEGIIVKSVRTNLPTCSGKFSFKVINPEFLLEYGE